MKRIYLLMVAICLTIGAQAQKSGDQLTIGSGGIKIHDKDDTIEHAVEIQYGLLDIGVNSLNDKTNYKSAGAMNFLKAIPEQLQNENLFSQNSGKSINVNIYPVLLRTRLLKTDHQKLYVSLGVGLQVYNFRFNKDISYRNDVQPTIVMDTVQFSKNKLAINYLSVPLMITSKTLLAPKAWLVYGVGLTAGYRLSSWTKQESGERGKEKNHDQFNFANFNTCVTGEIGVDGYFRLFASYQLTALASNGLDQHPISIGVRCLGI